MSDDPHPRVGDRAPDFALPDLDGRIVSLAEVRQGHHVVIHFTREFT
ncbi:MAG: redoxin domain-containing protein [Gemmatimonadetes bacterium]|jgi:peroxiredoxin|nr:redoxin domain-containing protein [Gemmatimonadota bacterium]MBP9106191.1 redoxin domain-containing protein [Gemmatimonadaceae bacterium]MBK6455041.1 redoxin domain-containing protein [Gemmatimonadota bacterium]MBK6841224.1 redoxin domain-containing protein [Gemmatimonadota bacterium]MBK7834912.1 redoxin domain-containing protein [Gemmatimonadota bacterium]